MSYLSRNDIETIAARITRSYERLPRFEGQEVSCIDPEILTCDLCGLSLGHCRISHSGDTLGLTAYCEMGVLVYDDDWQPFVYDLDGNTILVETALKNDPAQRGRYHFTVMHEAAHQILTRMDPTPRSAIQKRVVYYRGGVQRFPIQDWDEWQADALASALLLPTNIVLSALAKFDFPNGIEMLNKVFRPQVYSRFSEMADYLGASKQALAIRLKRLGLLKQDYLHNPYALVNIQMEDFE